MSRPPMTATNESTMLRWGLGAAAVAIASFLMVYYVQLLQGSVARGARWQTTVTRPPAGGPVEPVNVPSVVNVRMVTVDR